MLNWGAEPLLQFISVCSKELRSLRSNGSLYSRVANVRSSLSDSTPENKQIKDKVHVIFLY